jgi:arsenate reductase-like glutaredoxin family protein
MNIQFSAKQMLRYEKGRRYFKERRIKYQYIIYFRYGMSRGADLRKNAVGLPALIDEKDGLSTFAVLAYDADRFEKLFEDPSLIKTPVVRNGKQATWAFSRTCGRNGNNRRPEIFKLSGLFRV